MKSKLIIEEFISLLCDATPLARCSGLGVVQTSAWEQRAAAVVQRAKEFLKAKSKDSSKTLSESDCSHD